MNNKGKTMNLVHETYQIKGWDVVGPIRWTEIGNETELPFEDHQPDKRLHYVTGFDKANTKFMCIAEIEFCQVKNVFWEYLIGKYENEK